MDAILLFIETKWAWYQSLDAAAQIGIGLGVIGLPALLAVYLGWVIKPFKRKKPAPIPQPSPPTPLDPGRPLTRDEILRAATKGTITLEVAEGILALNRAETAEQAPDTAVPPDNDTDAAFVKAAIEIGNEGDQIEREALALFAQGETAAAAARYEADIQQAAGHAIEKLRRKGALFAPVDTHVAKDAYTRLLALAPDDLDARNRLGLLLKRLGELDQAKAAYQAVYDGAGGDRGIQATALGNLGIIAQTRGDLDAAQDYHQRSLAIEEALGRKEGMASDLGNLGIIAKTRGDLDAAQDYHQQALTIDEALGSKEGMASDLGNLGIIAETRGDLDAAQDYYQQALSIDEALGRKEGMASTLGNLGNIAKTRGDLDAAQDYYQQALSINEALGRKEGIAIQLGNLGFLAGAKGDASGAITLLKRAQAIYEEIGALNGEGGQIVQAAIARLEALGD